MPCLITALTRSANKKNTRNKQTTTKNKNKNFKAKTQYLKLKAPSNNLKVHSENALTTQIHFFQTIQQLEIFLNATR